MYGRKIWYLACGAALAFAATGALGLAGAGDRPLHLGAGLLTFVTVVFCHLWVILYLRRAGAALAGHRGEAPAPPGWVPPALVIAFALAGFAFGVAAYGGYAPGWSHGVAGGLAVVAQLWALWWEKRRLGDLEGAVSLAFAAPA
ncbi:MAG TPA: hypothetical protein PK413_09250 [Thermoanaerobaculia bacterium]|nr:hypothetical protein [Thermoanaerobaculia bacterium]